MKPVQSAVRLVSRDEVGAVILLALAETCLRSVALQTGYVGPVRSAPLRVRRLYDALEKIDRVDETFAGAFPPDLYERAEGALAEVEAVIDRFFKDTLINKPLPG